MGVEWFENAIKITLRGLKVSKGSDREHAPDPSGHVDPLELWTCGLTATNLLF